MYLAGVALVLVPFFALNRSIYDAWLSPYYHPAYHHGNPFFVEAFFGGLISPGRGLFIYSPILAFAVTGIVLKIRQRRFTSLDASLAASVFLYWIATAWVNPAWWGGDSYGPRFSTDLLPYLIYWIIPVVAWLETSAGQFRTIVAAAFTATAIVSVLMQAQGVFNRGAMRWNWEPAPLDKDLSRLWDWRHPPFLAGFVASPALAWNASAGLVGFYIVEAGKRVWPERSSTSRDFKDITDSDSRTAWHLLRTCARG